MILRNYIMRNILLSFSNDYYEPLKNGLKIYEHRKRFCDEEVKAFIYIGKPVYRIVALVTLGKRISLESWLKKYSGNEIVKQRVINFMERNNYAMPVLDFQEINPIELSGFKCSHPNFIIPRSYYFLENNLELKNYIFTRYKPTECYFKNDFSNEENNICTY